MKSRKPNPAGTKRYRENVLSSAASSADPAKRTASKMRANLPNAAKLAVAKSYTKSVKSAGKAVAKCERRKKRANAQYPNYK